jgi:hypothetical protein
MDLKPLASRSWRAFVADCALAYGPTRTLGTVLDILQPASPTVSGCTIRTSDAGILFTIPGKPSSRSDRDELQSLYHRAN